MRPVQINFVEPGAWKTIWAGAALVLLCIAAFTGVQMWRHQQSQAALQAELNQLQMKRLQLRQEQRTTTPLPGNPRAASEATVSRLLQRNWNEVFDTIESSTFNKVRLIQLSVDAQTGQAMLEYELESLESAALVTQALNTPTVANADHSLWQLERLENLSQGVAGDVAKARGVWRAVLR